MKHTNDLTHVFQPETMNQINFNENKPEAYDFHRLDENSTQLSQNSSVNNLRSNNLNISQVSLQSAKPIKIHHIDSIFSKHNGYTQSTYHLGHEQDNSLLNPRRETQTYRTSCHFSHLTLGQDELLDNR